MGMWLNAVTLCHFKMAVSGWTLGKAVDAGNYQRSILAQAV